MNENFEHINLLCQNFQKILLKQHEAFLLLVKKMKDFNNLMLFDQKKTEKIIDSWVNLVFDDCDKLSNKALDLNSKFTNSFQNFLLPQANNWHNNQTNNKNTTNFQNIFENFYHNKSYFDFFNENYSIIKNFSSELIESLELEDESKKYANFYLNNLIQFLDPKNNFFLNQEVVKKSLETKFENVIDGLENFINDLQNSDTIFNINNLNSSLFKIGENIAATEGKVIFQNDLCQLIYYKPKKQVYNTPIFILPPCVNKYYILDLSKNNSFVEWLVENNFEVFLVSFVNPDSSHSHLNFEDYINFSVIETTDYLKTIGYDKFSAIGYCIGGTLLACGISYLTKKNKNPFVSACFLATVLDFEDAGDISLMMNGEMIEKIKNTVFNAGYIDGKIINHWFNVLKSKDTFWKFFVNNYLLGKKPLELDIAYWNSDSINLTSSMYIGYLESMYVNNALKNGKLEILGTKINLKDIDIPTFFLATKDDHISPPNSVFMSANEFKDSKKTLCLGLSGHVAGVVNHPNKQKYGYYEIKNFKKENNKTEAELSDLVPGSWWNYYKNWQIENLENKSLVSSKPYDKVSYIENAPGFYVKRKVVENSK